MSLSGRAARGPKKSHKLHMRNVILLTTLMLTILVGVMACKKGELKPNVAPDTKIAISRINLQNEDRLNSVVHLNWFGTDIDGYVMGYELSFDAQTWFYTEKVDSTFLFAIPAGSDTVDIDFYVRSVDDKGTLDPTPAYLLIPMKNSVPTANFDTPNEPLSTVISVATYRWFAQDADGDETIVEAEMRWNDGDWYSIDPRVPLIAFVADSTGNGEAAVYYGNAQIPLATPINGIKLNNSNTLYLRVRDIAGAYSQIDTSQAVIIQKPTSSFLVISGQPSSVTQVYQPILNSLGLTYDFLDYGANGGAGQPKFWSPTFRLLLMQYEMAFVYADASLYTNVVTGQNAMILSYMGQGVQEFTDAGRKILITTQFANTSDMSAIRGIYPIEDLVLSSGQARISNDSALVSVAGSNYPNVQPQNILIGMIPIEKSADAEDFYRAQLTKLSGWTGDNLMGVRRRHQGNINHVFFGVGLYQFTKSPANLQLLFDEILLNDFNW
jgi:hypothetical protein